MKLTRPLTWLMGRGAFGLLLMVLLPGGAMGGGAFLVNGFGEPVVWDTAQPVVWNPDQGMLGMLTQAQAVQLVSDSFDIWGAVPHSALRFAAGPPLPCDVDQTNFGGPANAPCGTDILQILGNGGDGLSPVVFDRDGLLMDALFGAGAGDCIIGFAAVVGGSFVPPLATEGEAVLNGRFFDGNTANPELASLAAFQAVFVHEFGHWANLDHSQVNIRFLGDGDPANDLFLPTMIPTSTDDDTQLLSLNPDDEATLARLYPAPDLADSTARIQGSLLEADGATLFQGANLVLRSVDAPFLDAYSAISGNRFRPVAPSPLPLDPGSFGGPPPEALRGAFEFAGVKPGQYTLEVEEVDPFFTGGSGVGPLSIPVFVPGPDEFWNGENESTDPVVDHPGDSSLLSVAGGDAISGIDILLNALPPADLLYAVDDQLFDPNKPLGPGTIIELDMTSGTILRRIPTPEPSSALADGLAFAPSRASLFYTDGFGSGSIFELDPFPDASGVAGVLLNTLPHPAGAGSIDGLAFLEGPGQPAGGRLYALDTDQDTILALDPDTGAIDAPLSLVVSANLFGALGGSVDDLFVSTFGNALLHLRPADAVPLVNLFVKPDPSGVILGLGFDGATLYATSIDFPDFPLWRIAAQPATDPALPTGRLDVLDRRGDPTPVRFGGFSAADVALRGDLDGSQRVDGFDLAGLARVFGTSSPDAGFVAGADLDRDNDVDGADLAILAAFFGRSLSQAPR